MKTAVKKTVEDLGGYSEYPDWSGLFVYELWSEHFTVSGIPYREAGFMFQEDFHANGKLVQVPILAAALFSIIKRSGTAVPDLQTLMRRFGEQAVKSASEIELFVITQRLLETS